MYSTCIFCHSRLGRNESVEHFQVGRRLAFDSAKGRLWAVCSKCGRWNLTPIEERWEAIEECERIFGNASKRASTDEIGLARAGEGTDLIRIGKPLRPEFAAWRYGRNLRSRASTMAVAGGIAVAGYVGAFAFGLPMLGPLVGLAPATMLGFSRHAEIRAARKYIRHRAMLATGERVLDTKQVEIRIVPAGDEQGWALRFFGFHMPVDFTGRDALHIAHKVMPAINMMGGFSWSVRRAVDEIERAGSPESYFTRVVGYARENRMSYSPLAEFPSEIKLAVEMAAHEETERRAIVEGELRQLEDDWREAEEIAAIADNMFVPEEITGFIDRHRNRDQNPR